MPIPVIGKVLLGTALATIVVMKDGIIEVNVQEKQGERTHIHLYLPATLATWGIHFVPQERLEEKLRHSAEQLAVARAALHGLEKTPDALLVEVEEPSEHVRLATHSGNLVVDVDDPGDTVHISIPVRAARKVVEDLESKIPAGT